MSKRPKYAPPALPDFTQYDPRGTEGAKAIKHRRRITSWGALVDALDAHRRGLVTTNEIVEYLRWSHDLDVHGSMEWIRKHPEYLIPDHFP